jgi:hypothetical protein
MKFIRLHEALIFLLLLGVTVAIQLWQPVPYDADTSYHVAVGHLIAKHGILKSFPWTPFSILAENYADKEFLFHLLFVPLAGLEWINAARIVGALCGLLLLMVMWAVLKKEQVRWPWLWALLPLAFSGWFAHRFGLVRPHLLAIPLAISVFYFSSTRKPKAVFVACMLYPLSYVGWPIALLLAGVGEGLRAWKERAVCWRVPAAVLAGLAIGLLIHPNFPNIVKIAWIQNVVILIETAWSKKTGFSLGTELNPLGYYGFLRFGLLPTIAVIIAGFVAITRRRDDSLLVGCILLALLFGGMTLMTARFIEYFAPFAGISLALASRSFRWRTVAPVVILLSVIYTLSFGFAPLKAMHSRRPDFSTELQEVLRRTVPVGAQVFTCGFGLTGEMMLALPERRFIVALDPLFFYINDPERYQNWYQLVHNPPLQPSRQIRKLFGADWALCETGLSKYWGLLKALNQDQGARLVYKNNLWALYRIR